MRSTPSGRKDAPLSCETTQGLLAELALGVLTGRERAGAIEHVEECPRCRLSLRELASAADALLALAPEADPGPDLEVRVLDRLRRAEHLPPRRLSHWWRVAVVGGAVTVAGLSTALGLVLGSQTQPAGVGNALTSRARLVNALLREGPAVRGEVSLLADRSNWIFMAVRDAGVTSRVECEVTTRQGATFDVGTFWLDHGAGTWVSKLVTSPSDLRSAKVVGPNGVVLATASLDADRAVRSRSARYPEPPAGHRTDQ